MIFNDKRTWIEVNLDNYRNNINLIKNHVGKDVKILAVVKANAYGHGAVEIAKQSELLGVSYLAVACIDEARQIRESGVKLPILILSHSTPLRAEEIVKYDIIPTVFNIEISEKLNEYARLHNTVIKVHIKLDTGMTRIGFNSDKVEETVNDILYINSLPNLKIDGMFTHFSDADNENFKGYTDLQFKKFMKIAEILKENNVDIPLKHVCNSAATIEDKDKYLDMVRPGIIIYGYYPEKYLKKKLPGLKEVMEIKSSILQIREVDENVSVGYGRTFTTDKTTKIGVVPIGYADGYPRILSNKFYILVNGKKANILGRVCMDQIMVDLTDIPECYEGQEVVILGKSKNERISADDIAKATDTISYEILCSFSDRLPIVYTEGGKVSKIVEFLK